MYNKFGDIMEEIFIEKLWLKPISPFLLFLLLFIGSLVFCPNTTEETYAKVILYWIAASILFAIYTSITIKNNILPKCKNGYIGVLFVFNCATEAQYKDFRFSIENNFKSVLQNSPSKIAPVCINKNKLNDFDIYNNSYMKKLLNKTNCYICIELFVESNNPDNPTIYTTKIHTGILHPNISAKTNKYLHDNLSFGTQQIRKLQFDTKEKINILNKAANYLALLSEYIIGILLLIGDNPDESILLLNSLIKKIENTHILHKITCEGLYASYILKISRLFDSYYRTSNIAILDEITHYLSASEKVAQDKYQYHLNMAYVVFLRHRDLNSAKKHIKECKTINKDNRWKYSEAFLLAYESNDPNMVYGKYKALTSNEYSYNATEIIEFIENVLQIEPEKAVLHLALGLLYSYIGDSKLTSCNYKLFLHKYNGDIPLRKNTIRTIKKEIDNKYCESRQEFDDCDKCALFT